jgi:HK97 family phage major capsid protein
MSDLNEIKELVEKINPVLVELRGEVDSVKNRDVIDEAKFSKMANEVTAKMDELQAKQRKLEASQNRIDAGSAGDEQEAEQKQAFNSFMRSKARDKTEIEVRAMSTTPNEDGGYLVRPGLSATIITRIFETSPLRGVANIETGSTKSIDLLIDDDEAESVWAAENSTVNSTGTPDLGQKEIVAHAQRARPSISMEMLQDAYLDIEGWLIGKVTDKFARTENSAFVRGNGVGKPRGFLDYADQDTPGTYQRDRLKQTITGVAANVGADGFIAQQAALKEAYQARAVWGMKRATFGEALKLKGADNYFFSPVLLRDGQASMQLLGKPVIFMDDMDAVGAGNLATVYGDFRAGYTIYDRIGLQILRDPFTAAGQARVVFNVFKRVGGDVTNFEAIVIGRCAAP